MAGAQSDMLGVPMLNSRACVVKLRKFLGQATSRKVAAYYPCCMRHFPFCPSTPIPTPSELPFFTVLERESKVLGCAAVKPLGCNAEGAEVAELSAFCVHPAYRGGGKGDSLLEYLGACRAVRLGLGL